MKSLRLFVAVGTLALGAIPAVAETETQREMAKNCWVDVFDDTKYEADDPHTRIQGPMELPSLKSLNGKNWNNDIQSVIVGPDATVRAYKDKDFKGTEIAFAPGQRVPDLSKLDMSNDIESMKVACNTP
jgi:beta/gamma crystallin